MENSEGVKFTDFELEGTLVQCAICKGFLEGSKAYKKDFLGLDSDTFSNKVFLCPLCKEGISKGLTLKSEEVR